MKLIIAFHKKDPKHPPLAFLADDKVRLDTINELLPDKVDQTWRVIEVNSDELNVAQDETIILSTLNKETPR